MTQPSRPEPGLLAQTTAMLSKEGLLAWRGRARFVSVALFGVVTLLLFSFAAGPETQVARVGASGYIILALLMTSTLALSESLRIETDDGSLEALLLLPLDASALFLGKAIATTALLTLMGPIFLPLGMALFGVHLDAPKTPAVLGLWALASAGLTAPGTLYAAMTARTGGQDVLLPILLFPLEVPMLVAAVKCLGLLLTGDPMGQIGSWMTLLALFDIVYWTLGTVLAAYVLEERR